MNITYELLANCKSVGLLGLGVSNLGVLEFLKGFPDKNIIIRTERKEDKAQIPNAVKTFIGENALADIREDILFLSPSARRGREEIKRAVKNGVIISSDAEAFFDLVNGSVFAVTGSDGKSTTCELSYRLLLSDSSNTYKSGNCGSSMLSALNFDGLNVNHIVELSSFMLEYMKPKLFRSVITNITENHLDWHGSYENYIRSKENILENSEECALWYDDEICISLAKRHKPSTLISEKHTAKELSAICDYAITLEGGRICECGTPILSIDKIKRKEPYNIKNFMSAAALCHGHYNRDALTELAQSFDGIEHRCKSLGLYAGIEYIDSSIDSTPERTRQTIAGLGKRVVLILGGRGKGLSYLPLIQPIKKYCEAVVICGENTREIKSALEGDKDVENSVPIYEKSTLEEATMLAGQLAVKCKRVLLSPASTSYNEFKNFEERGKTFQKYIKMTDFEKKGLHR